MPCSSSQTPSYHGVELECGARPSMTSTRQLSSWWSARMASWLDSVRGQEDGGKFAKQRSVSSFRPLDTFKRPNLRGFTTASIVRTLSADIESLTTANSSASPSKHTLESKLTSTYDHADHVTSILYDRFRYVGRMWNVYRTAVRSPSPSIMFYCPIDTALPMDETVPFFLLPEDPTTTLLFNSVRVTLLRSISGHTADGVRPYENGVKQSGDAEAHSTVIVDQLHPRGGVVCGNMTVISGWQRCREVLFPSLSARGKTGTTPRAFRSGRVCVQYKVAVRVDVVPADSNKVVQVTLETPTIMLAMPPPYNDVA